MATLLSDRRRHPLGEFVDRDLFTWKVPVMVPRSS